MNKKKWEEKSKDLQKFEEQELNFIKERFSKYERPLAHLNLTLDIDLSWFNQQENEDISFSRIEFKDGYICTISITIRRQEEPQNNLDLKCINCIHPISKIGQTLFRYLFGLGICFSKVPKKMLNEFLENTEKVIKEVLDKGYDNVLGELNKENI